MKSITNEDDGEPKLFDMSRCKKAGYDMATNKPNAREVRLSPKVNDLKVDIGSSIKQLMAG